MRTRRPARAFALVLPFLGGCSLTPSLVQAPPAGRTAVVPSHPATYAIQSNPQIVPGLLGDPFPIALVAPHFRYSEPEVAYNAADRQYLAIWTGAALRHGLGDIYGQLLDQGGAPIGPMWTIAEEPGSQFEPGIAYNRAAHEYLVTWNNQETRGGPTEVYAQLLKPDGSPVGGAIVLATNPGREDTTPCVAANPDAKEFLVAWSDAPNSATNVYARRVGRNGKLLGDAFAVAPGAGFQTEPSVAYNTATGEYLVAWEEDRGDGLGDILGQRIGDDGSRIRDVLPIATEAGRQSSVKVACNENLGRYFVVWASDLLAGTGVYGRQLGQKGNAIGDELPIAVSPGVHFAPSVAFNPVDDQYMVAWIDNRDAGSFHTYAQRVGGANAKFLGADFTVATQGEDYTPALAFNGAQDEFLAIWEQDGSIIGRRVDGSGR